MSEAFALANQECPYCISGEVCLGGVPAGVRVCPTCRRRIKRCRACETSNRHNAVFCRLCRANLPEARAVDWPALLGGAHRRAMVSSSPSEAVGTLWRYPDREQGLGQPCETLVIGWGIVFTVTRSGLILAIDQYAGRPLWREDLREPVAGSPLLCDEWLLVCASSGALRIFDARRGGCLVEQDLECEITAAPVMLGTRLFLAARRHGAFCMVAFEITRLQVQRLWVYGGTETQPFSRVSGAPAAEQGTIVLGDVLGWVRVLNAETGTLRWEELIDDGSPVYSAPVIAHDSVFAASRNGRCCRFDLASGRKVGWVSSQAAAPVYSSLTVTDDRAYLTTASGFVYEFDSRTGGELAATEVPRCPGWNSGLTSGVATRDYVFFGANSGHVYAYHRISNWPVMMVRADSAVVTSPAWSDGAIYFATERGFVYGVAEWRAADENA